MQSKASARGGASLDSYVREIVREEIDRAQRFPWESISKLGITPRRAHLLAKRDGVQVTKIGRELYIHVADLERVARANVVAHVEASAGSSAVDLALGIGGTR